jgi:hypothetical protein
MPEIVYLILQIDKALLYSNIKNIKPLLSALYASVFYITIESPYTTDLSLSGIVIFAICKK